MWSLTHAQCGTPQLRDEQREWVATYKLEEDAREALELHNWRESQKLAATVNPRTIVWESRKQRG